MTHILQLMKTAHVVLALTRTANLFFLLREDNSSRNYSFIIVVITEIQCNIVYLSSDQLLSWVKKDYYLFPCQRRS